MVIEPSPSNMSKQRWQQAIIGDFKGLSIEEHCKRWEHQKQNYYQSV